MTCPTFLISSPTGASDNCSATPYIPSENSTGFSAPSDRHAIGADHGRHQTGVAGPRLDGAKVRLWGQDFKSLQAMGELRFTLILLIMDVPFSFLRKMAFLTLINECRFNLCMIGRLLWAPHPFESVMQRPGKRVADDQRCAASKQGGEKDAHHPTTRFEIL